MERDLKALITLLDDNDTEVYNHVFNKLLSYGPDAATLRDYLADANQVYACDTETTGLEILDDTIIGHSFSTGKDAIAIKYVGPHPQSDPRWEVVKSFLEGPIGKGWQNGPFDTEIGRSHGINETHWTFDTRLAQQLLYSDLPSDLDFLRSQYTPEIPSYKPPKSRRKNIQHWGTQEMLEYAAWDAYTTARVMEEQLKRISPKELKLLQEHLIPLSHAIGNIRRRGFKVNVTTLAGLQAQCEPVIEAIDRIS